MSNEKLRSIEPSTADDDRLDSSLSPLTLNKLDSFPARLLSSSAMRRTFNICDILAKPASVLSEKSHPLKLLIEHPASFDDDNEHTESISDWEVSGKTQNSLGSVGEFFSPLLQMMLYRRPMRRPRTRMPSSITRNHRPPIQTNSPRVDGNARLSPTSNWWPWRTNSNKPDISPCAKD